MLAEEKELQIDVSVGDDVPDDDNEEDLAALRPLEYAKLHAKREWFLVKDTGLWKPILFGAIMQYVHSVMTNVVYYLHRPGERLRDLGFELLPELPEGVTIVSELLFFSLFLSALVFAVHGFAVKRSFRKQVFASVVLSRALVAFSICEIFRCLSFVVTVLPSPASHCQPDSDEYDPPETFWDIVFRLDAFKGCGDLIFSSHTLMAITCALLLTKYAYQKGRWPKWAIALVWCTILALGLFIVAGRKHYSVDVIVAWYVVPMVWLLLDHYWPDKTLPNFNEVGLGLGLSTSTPLLTSKENRNANLARDSMVMSPSEIRDTEAPGSSNDEQLEVRVETDEPQE
ncbi:MAG: hypothetical protein MHM6MM_002365 [Cercozoa sp. M6MM]